MIRMVGFRNLAIHEYDRIDLSVVDSLFDAPLEDLLRFVDSVQQSPGGSSGLGTDDLPSVQKHSSP